MDTQVSQSWPYSQLQNAVSLIVMIWQGMGLNTAQGLPVYNDNTQTRETERAVILT